MANEARAAHLTGGLVWRWWFTGFQYEGAVVEVAVEVAVEAAVEVWVMRGEEAEE